MNKHTLTDAFERIAQAGLERFTEEEGKAVLR